MSNSRMFLNSNWSKLSQSEAQDLFSSMVIKMGRQSTRINELEEQLDKAETKSEQLVEDLRHAVEQLQRLQTLKSAGCKPSSIIVPQSIQGSSEGV